VRAFNLIPPDERGSAGIDTGKSGGGAFVVLGLLGVLAIFALLYGVARHQISSQNAKVAALTAEAQVAQAQAARLAPYVSFATLHEQRVQAVDQLVDSRFDWAHAFHEIGRVLPKSSSLSSLSGTIGATTGAATTAGSSASSSSAAGAASGTVASATPPGSIPTFTLSGCATSQTEVALTLDRLRLIDGVNEVTLQSSTKPGAGTAGGGAGASGGCQGNQATFAMLITFDPLPSASATSSQNTTSAAQPTTSTGGVG
jgi:Tfp pilus assembly protein PilN